MAVRFQLRRSTPHLIAIALCGLFVVGCGETDQIRSYSAPKELKPVVSQAAPGQTSGDATDRMLAAILVVGKQAYFFKAVGPAADVDSHEKDLRTFFTGLQVGPDGKPKWQLPADWKEAAGNDVVMSKITIPTSGKPLEISVTALPWRDDLLGNVNRWRKQMQLAPTTARQLGQDVEETKAGELPLTIVDLHGHFGGSGMAAPFAGAAAPPSTGNGTPPNLPAGHPPLGESASGLPPGHPDIGAAPPANPANLGDAAPPVAEVEVPKFTAPADWQALPAAGLRKAQFAVGDKDHGALVTLINFPAHEGPMIADPLQNVNRWRGEAGLTPVTADDLSKVTELIEVDGQTATYVPAIPEASKTQPNRAELAAMVKNGDQIWFIKLVGDRDVVVAQEAAFKTFLKSLRFAGDHGATDGHK